MNRDAFREHLESLTDTALEAECVSAIRAYRRIRERGPAGAMNQAVTLAWYECQRRNAEDIYHAALETVRAEEREAAEQNLKAIAEIGKRPEEKESQT